MYILSYSVDPSLTGSVTGLDFHNPVIRSEKPWSLCPTSLDVTSNSHRFIINENMQHWIGHKLKNNWKLVVQKLTYYNFHETNPQYETAQDL